MTMALTACGGGGGGRTDAPPTPDEVVADGRLTLSGVDTSAIGTELVVGDAALVADAVIADQYFLVDASSRIAGFEYDLAQLANNELGDNTTIGDPLNFFVMIVYDGSSINSTDGLSLSILLGGVNYNYAIDDAAGIDVDAATRTIRLTNVVALPDGASNSATGPLTISGTIVCGIEG